MNIGKAAVLAAAIASLAIAVNASAQTIKVGVITTYSGPGAAQGDQLDKGFKLYLKLNADKLPAGVKVEPVFRDDTGANPDAARRLAQELIVRDKVQFLTGVVWTPNAAAIAPLTAEAKVPFVIANAAGVTIPLASPYVARVSFTLWQASYPLGQWAAKKFKRAYTVVSDFAPGHEAEEGFIKGFKEGGGQIIGSARVPMTATDFIPYMQRVKDAKPDVLFAFNPAGKQA
ncbi:MAG: ABC transporter substrate-binding protein, partial [Betaproteobacteria bacterium]|nr:ABC transporter substrate-binding protein [Betaproteobacteria bacterium]